jgi:hypothetical protein
MTNGSLGGATASLWEFEVQRPSEPRLRRLYLGRSLVWESFVVACTAPAADFDLWRPTFTRMTESFWFFSGE